MQLDDPYATNEPPAQSSGPSFDQVNADYQKYLGRPLSPQEYSQYWAGRTDYNAGLIANSPEGLAYTNQQVPGTPNYDPNAPVYPGNYTGQRPVGGDYVPPENNTTTGTTQPPLTTTNSNNPGITTTPTGTGGGSGAPLPNLPSTPGQTAAPTPFSYADFQEPTLDDLYADPGYQSELKTGLDAVNKSAAARGVLHTGGTFASLMGFGSDLARSHFADLYGRKFNTYSANRSNAFETWKANTGAAQDARDFNYQTQYRDPYQQAMDLYGAQSHSYDQDLYYQTHRSDLDRMYAYNNKLFDADNAYRNRALDFDQKYRVLGLL